MGDTLVAEGEQPMSLNRNPSNESAAGGETGGDVARADGGRPGRNSNQTATAPAARGGKLVLLRCRREEGPADGETGATSELRLDLQAPIDNLRSIGADLEVYYWERPGKADIRERERYQVSLWIRQVSERTAALEGIVMHMGARAVVLAGVGPAERQALRSATKFLDRWIREDEPFNDVLRQVATILNAADVICLRAAGGRPEPGAGPPRI